MMGSVTYIGKYIHTHHYSEKIQGVQFSQTLWLLYSKSTKNKNQPKKSLTPAGAMVFARDALQECQ